MDINEYLNWRKEIKNRSRYKKKKDRRRRMDK